MEYNVKITDKALNDIENIYNYIANVLLNIDGAIKQYNKLSNSISSLNMFPERHRIINLYNGDDLRRMIVDNYSIFYIIKEDKVIIVSVLYGSLNIDERLKKLKL